MHPPVVDFISAATRRNSSPSIIAHPHTLANVRNTKLPAQGRQFGA